PLGLRNRHSLAVKDWDRSLELAEAAAHAQIRLERASALARAKEHAQATAEADAATHEKPADPDILYNAACVYALSAAAPADAQQGERYATRAVELLRGAVAKGWKNVEAIKKDSDLDLLHRRDDFKQLLTDLERKTKSSETPRPSHRAPAEHENAHK